MARLRLTHKLAALMRAHLQPRALLETCTGDTAVILFTSGSEALPKAVPLSHHNLLSNLRDISARVR